MKKKQFFNLLRGVSFILLWMITSTLFAQNITVSGKVSDEKGEQLPGVTITVVGSTKGVISDIDGNFSIDVSAKDKLLFSFVGFESQTIDVENQRKKALENIKKLKDLYDVDVKVTQSKEIKPGKFEIEILKTYTDFLDE